MRLLIVCLLGAGLTLWAQPHAPVVPFRLYEDFQPEPPSAVRGAIRTEVESLLTPIGWRIEWDSIQNAGPVSTTLAIATFKGPCSVDDLTATPLHGATLGRTHVSDGVILPFTDILCPAIRAILAPSLKKTAPQERDFLYGRAVGRVLAHELYHILANESGHGSKGVAEPRFTSEELLAEDFRFERKQVQKLRFTLLPILLQSYESTDAKGEQKGLTVFISSGCSGCHGSRGEGTHWGPPLRIAGRHYNRRKVEEVLGNPSLEMYRRGFKLNVRWPSLQLGEIEILVDLLNRLTG